MKITLDQTYILNGKFHGPGEVEVDADTGKALQARMAELNPQEAKPKAARNKPAPADAGADGSEQDDGASS